MLSRHLELADIRAAIKPQSPEVQALIQAFSLPKSDSHKGQNGKVLVIGGSDLFHAASKWSLDTISKIVDMAIYSSTPANNQLVTEAIQASMLAAKREFWNGIVVSPENLPDYLEEVDVVLIGPGMERKPETAQQVNALLQSYSHKKWVIDAGALQMVDPVLIPDRAILTPHQLELERLEQHGFQLPQALAKKITVILKGQADQIFSDDLAQQSMRSPLPVEGGNPGMTKGGTGDVLAGLVAALYATQDPLVAAVVASLVNKTAGDVLYQFVGPFFNASDLVEVVPVVLWQVLQAVGTER